MAKLVYNLDTIKDYNIEAGRYKAKLIKVEQTLSAKKLPMLVWTWKILSGEAKGSEIRSYTSLVETALGGLKSHLTAFNLKGKVNTDTSRLIGKIALIVVVVQPSTRPDSAGSLFSSVASVLSANTPVNDEDEDDEEYEEEDEEEDYDEDEEDEEDYDEDDEDEDYDDDEDEEEEEESPKRKAKKAVVKKPVRKPAAKKPARRKPRF